MASLKKGCGVGKGLWALYKNGEARVIIGPRTSSAKRRGMLRFYREEYPRARWSMRRFARCRGGHR